MIIPFPRKQLEYGFINDISLEFLFQMISFYSIRIRELNKRINEILIIVIIAPNEQIVVGKSDNQLSLEQKAGVPQ